MGRRSGLRRALNGADGGGDFPWLEWRDGRPRRLKRGKHYTGDSKLVERRARIAAEDLGKIAVTSKDGSGGYEYLWIQFVDAEVEVGRPSQHVCQRAGNLARPEVLVLEVDQSLRPVVRLVVGAGDAPLAVGRERERRLLSRIGA